MGSEPSQALPATACTVCVENKDDGLNIMWRGGARQGRSGREREGDDWPLLGIMENLEEDPLCCCRAVSDEEWLLSLLILPSHTTISNLPSL